MSSYIPQEVLFKIFLKVPLKTLVCCTCVSKSWRSIIADPIFISAHLYQMANSNDKSLLLRRSFGIGSHKEEQYSLHLDTETLDLYQELEFPFSKCNKDFKLVGTCNGLLCLSCPDILLWNPLIRRSVSVPWTSDIISAYGDPDNYALGFGFDSRANDFKVIRLSYFEDKSSFKYKRPPKVEVYELRTGCWRTISRKAPRCETVKSEWTPAFVNGASHWVAFMENARGYKCFVLKFDLIEESFTVMALPECLVNYSPYSLKVVVVEAELAILLSGCIGLETYVSSVWVMEKYGEASSWSEAARFQPWQGLRMFLRRRENGAMIMTSISGEVVLYRPENEIVKELGICDAEDSVYLDKYVESLALLNDGKVTLERDNCTDRIPD